MNCYEHEERSAVAVCGGCGVGLCKECVDDTIFNINNQALCRKCNYNVACENDQIFNSALSEKKIIMIINSAACVLGLIVFGVIKLSSSDTFKAVIGMLICWSIGFIIGNIFNKNQVKNKEKKVELFSGSGIEIIGRLIGVVLGFFIQALFSPIIIGATFIGMNKVKKQIAENNEILASFGMGNERAQEGQNNNSSVASANKESRIYEYDGNFSYCPPRGWNITEYADFVYKIVIGPIDNKFAVNINFVEEAFEGSIKEYVDTSFSNIHESFDSCKQLGRSEFITNSGIVGECVITNNIQEGNLLRQIYYFFPLPGNICIVITCTSLESVCKKYLSVFDETIKTFEIIN